MARPGAAPGGSLLVLVCACAALRSAGAFAPSPALARLQLPAARRRASTSSASTGVRGARGNILLLDHLNINHEKGRHDLLKAFYFDVLKCAVDPRKVENWDKVSAATQPVCARCASSVRRVSLLSSLSPARELGERKRESTKEPARASVLVCRRACGCRGRARCGPTAASISSTYPKSKRHRSSRAASSSSTQTSNLSQLAWTPRLPRLPAASLRGRARKAVRSRSPAHGGTACSCARDRWRTRVASSQDLLASPWACLSSRSTCRRAGAPTPGRCACARARLTCALGAVCAGPGDARLVERCDARRVCLTGWTWAATWRASRASTAGSLGRRQACSFYFHLSRLGWSEGQLSNAFSRRNASHISL